jgi:hypothetical protein
MRIKWQRRKGSESHPSNAEIKSVCVDLNLHFVIRFHDMLIESLAYTFFFISLRQVPGTYFKGHENFYT